jgi:SAM-dependent methyltransferase
MRASAPETWQRPDIVAGFAQASPNPQLLAYARQQQRRHWAPLRVADIGCGAGRNAVPLAEAGYDVIGLDRSRPMLAAAAARPVGGSLQLIEAAMDDLPLQDNSVDLIVAHGIWNLARSDQELREALAESARIATADATAFVFTFSRHTLPVSAVPVDGESLTFTDFSGAPQVFLAAEQLLAEMAAVGFEPDPTFRLRELNLPPAGQARLGGAPVIFEAAFRFSGR